MSPSRKAYKAARAENRPAYTPNRHAGLASVRRGPANTGKNRAPKITTGQKHWDKPAALPFSTGVVAHDVRWSA